MTYCPTRAPPELTLFKRFTKDGPQDRKPGTFYPGCFQNDLCNGSAAMKGIKPAGHPFPAPPHKSACAGFHSRALSGAPFRAWMGASGNPFQSMIYDRSTGRFVFSCGASVLSTNPEGQPLRRRSGGSRQTSPGWRVGGFARRCGAGWILAIAWIEARVSLIQKLVPEPLSRRTAQNDHKGRLTCRPRDFS